MKMKGYLRVILALCVLGLSAAVAIPCDNPDFGLSPYTWKCSGVGDNARAEAMMPGAYFKTIVAGTARIDVAIDGVANTGCPSSSMPVIEYSIDDSPFVTKQLAQTGAVYAISLATELDRAVSHRIEFYFRAADLTQKRWTSSAAHLRIAGVSLDEGGTLTAYPMRPKRAIGFGDSITEGVGVDGLFTSWQSIGVNNARGSWFAFVCNAINCEYGQLGSGGQGMVREFEIPTLLKTWDRYDADTTRLTDGLLLPEPDYVFCCMGTNDYGGIDIASAYGKWLTTVRKACPHTHIFCVVPPSGVHRNDIRSVVATRNEIRDDRVHLIDIPSLNSAITARAGASQMTFDGAHPTMQGEGMFGASVAVKVQEILDRADDLKKAPKQAAWRQRRIMYNDDGCHEQPYSTPEEFVALRLRQVADTQVDTICYCTGGGGLFWGHVPRVGELIGEFVSDGDAQYVKDIGSSIRSLDRQGTDPLAIAVKFGHEHRMEVFWSSRMNNIEDSFAPWARSRWKREHPEYLFGTPDDWEKYEMTDPRKWWAALDFAAPEVRDYMLSIFEDVFTRYDIDGIDTDWFRGPRYFRETNEDRPAEPQHVAMMNDFLRKVRALADRAASARHRPFLISCRVPLSVERCLAIGLDVPAWLEEDLVDILVLGGDLGPMAMAPQLQSMAELAHKYRVPAVANICGSGLQPAHGYYTKETWWAAAMNAWHAGVDGIYTFNLFPSEPDDRFTRLGSPDTLKGLDKVYAIDPIEPRDFWGFDRAGLVVPDRLPITLVPDTTVTARLPVGEDLAASAPKGKTPHVCLRIRLSAAAEGDQLRITLNGVDLDIAAPMESLGTTPAAAWFRIAPPIHDIRLGENRVDVHFTTSRPADSPVLIDRLELTLKYQAEKG